jgi:hypothetical protein
MLLVGVLMSRLMLWLTGANSTVPMFWTVYGLDLAMSAFETQTFNLWRFELLFLFADESLAAL